MKNYGWKQLLWDWFEAWCISVTLAFIIMAGILWYLGVL